MLNPAREAVIGGKRLYRYFSSIAELIWGGLESAVETSGRFGFRPGCGPSDGNVLARLRDSAVVRVQFCLTFRS